MSDDELLAALQAVFDANDLADGIDRSDGYGEDYRVESLRVVPGEDGFDDLEVTIRTADGAATFARLLFDRAWREASGFTGALDYAAYVVARWRDAVVATDGTADLGAPGTAWDGLVAWLEERYPPVVSTATGFRLVDDGEVHLHVTEQQWATYAASRPQPTDELAEMIGSRWDDEDHVVFFRRGFHRSIRAELPPVRSMLLREPAAEGRGAAR